MALSAKGVFSDYTNDTRNLDKFFIFVNSLHKNNVPSVKRNFRLGEKNIPVTLGFSHLVSKTDEDIMETDSEFFPTFVLYRGYDHRASNTICKYFGLEASLKENLSGEELFSLFQTSACVFFLASIVSEYSDKDAAINPTHIILVQRAFLDENGVKHLEYVNPAQRLFRQAVKVMSMNDFEKIFNKFGTLIK
jgi:hypothetical protein